MENFRSINILKYSIHQVVNDITYNLESSLKQLDNITEEIKEQLS
jgi:hypothetical protein